jgi:RNA-binding protein
MGFTPTQRKHLRALAHKLKPIVQLGTAGVTAPVLKEIEQALARHALLSAAVPDAALPPPSLESKIRLPGVEHDERTEMFQKICAATGAEAVQEIGRMAVLYRPAEKPRLKLPE